MKFLSVCSGIEAASVAWSNVPLHRSDGAGLGWEAVGFSEIEPFPCAVLAHHYPDVPNYGDLTKWKEWGIKDGAIDLICGGTPCQSFSVAGLRKGMADPRGNLAITFLGLVDAVRPKWVVWENVPGVLSSGQGRDLGSFLGALGQLGYGWAYRVVDTQYVRVDGFGRAIPQRRRRVFVVGRFGNMGLPRNAEEIQNCRRAQSLSAAVLFERESLCGNPAPRRKKGQGVAPAVGKCLKTCSGGVDREDGHTLIPAVTDPLTARPYSDRGASDDSKLIPNVANCLQTTCNDHTRSDGFNMVADTCGVITAGIHKGPRGTEAVDSDHLVTCYENHAQDSRIKDHGDLCPTLAAKSGTGGGNLSLVQCVHGTQDPDVNDELAHPLARNNGQENAIAIHDMATRHAGTDGSGRQAGKGHGLGISKSGDPMFTLTSGDKHGIALDMTVRRLTEIEAERLMGFEDNYTRIPWKGKPAEQCPSGHRYKAVGNSWAINSARWIGTRIQMVEEVAV